MSLMARPNGTPDPSAKVVEVAKVKVAVVELAVAGADRMRLVPATDETVVFEAMPGPLTPWPAAMAAGNEVTGPLPLSVAVVEPEFVVTSTISRSGPRLVSWPQSVILVHPPAHHRR